MIGRRSCLAGLGALTLQSACTGATHQNLFSFRAPALGTQMQITLSAIHAQAAHELFSAARVKVQQFEDYFSLYQPHSLISLLNRTGYIDHPPPEFVHLLRLAKEYHRYTQGAFDITIQPLWHLYSQESHPDEITLTRIRNHIDSHAIHITDTRIHFDKPDMSISLNGCAQGFITDKITEFLRLKGCKQALVNIGEYAALGQKKPRQDWQVAIENPSNLADIIRIAALNNQALATSGGYGGQFGTHDSNAHHIFDPRTAKSPTYWQSLSVLAATASMADILATALYCAPSITALRTFKQNWPSAIQIIAMDHSHQVWNV